ncbi:hypothetical protein M2302_003915 [Micromonospora sp. A200]|uniref:GerMN domain-containing protein n=1 Tax=Micromonospora sp. A200 TaxID=2940568 RepID=UPI0024769A02|nr:GerMN domain-containing protein [Micromonospora sp. A200]MDH6463718.1 hypothetical protein [Micromonospora sp. A200]
MTVTVPDVIVRYYQLTGEPDIDALVSCFTDDASVMLAGSQAQVAVNEAADDAGRSDEVLAYGQIVCTLTSRHEVTTVAFLRDGAPLGVPRADGSLAVQPLTRADYAPLISRR